jgi:hypothetical protein
MAKRSTILESINFTGRWGKKRLLEAIRSQSLISGSVEIAREAIKCGDLLHYAPKEALMHQGKPENDIFLIVSGEVVISVNGRPVVIRSGGTHIGEMALVDVVATRSATAVAAQPTTAIRIPEYRFTRMATKHPELWRRIAVEIAKRLRERSKFLSEPHNEPVLFVGSSTEGKRFDNTQDIISAVTLQGHPLAGWRYWHVYSIGMNDLVVETGAADVAGPGYINYKGYQALHKEQLKIWQELLQFILRDLQADNNGKGDPNATQGSNPQYNNVNGEWNPTSPSLTQIMNYVCQAPTCN